MLCNATESPDPKLGSEIKEVVSHDNTEWEPMSTLTNEDDDYIIPSDAFRHIVFTMERELLNISYPAYLRPFDQDILQTPPENESR